MKENKKEFYFSIIFVFLFLVLVAYLYITILIMNQSNQIRLFLTEIGQLQAARILEYSKNNQIEIENKELQTIVDETFLDGAGYFDVIDSSGTIIIRSNHPEVNRRISNIFNTKFSKLEDKESLRNDLSETRNGIIQISFYEDNIQKIATYTPIGNTGLYVFSVVLQETINATFAKIIVLTILFVMILIVTAITLLIYIRNIKQREKKALQQLELDKQREIEALKIKLTEKVEIALKKDEFKLYIQPKVNEEEKVIGGEVLVRWHTKEGTVIFPNEFITIFEKFGLIMRLDQYMLEQLCKQQKKWLQEGKHYHLSINQSPLNLHENDYVEKLVGIIDNYAIAHELIEIEFTENVFIKDKELVQQTIRKLHEKNIKVAMDDFGSGFSSFNMLKNFDIDVLKIDKEFLTEETNQEKGKILIDSIVKMCKQLNIQTVAEGVSTQEQVAFLKQINCDRMQGYFYGKPMTVEEFEKLIEKKDTIP